MVVAVASRQEVVLGALLVVGYLIGLPALAWLRRDLYGFRHMLWTGYGNRERRIRAATIAYLLGGWPVLVVALVWRRSTLRAELLVERADFRDEHHP